MSNFDDVRIFMQTFGQEIKEKADFPDEKITSLEKKTFFDPIHTLIKGNKIISNNIYFDLLNIFKTHLLK